MSLRIIPLNSSLSYMRTHEINAHEPLGIILLETAKQIFRECGAEHDFCVQHITDDYQIKQQVSESWGDYPVQIFGGCNRLLWHPIQGWYISEEHCGADFIKAFDALKKRGRVV